MVFKDIEKLRLFALLVTIGFAFMIGRILHLMIEGCAGIIVGAIASIIFIVVVAVGMAAVDG